MHFFVSRPVIKYNYVTPCYFLAFG
jgi:hypothetical protein